MTFKEKKDILTNFGIEEIDLDEVVHSVKDTEASEINNQGLDAQLSYLFNKGYSVKDIQNMLLT